MLSDFLVCPIKNLLDDDNFSPQCTQVQNALRTASAVLKWAKHPNIHGRMD